MARSEAGLRQRHGRGCPQTGRCSCPWEAAVYSSRDDKKIRKTFPTRAAAIAWRDDARGLVRRNQLRGPSVTTLEQEAEEWLKLAREGVIRNRSGDVYKPSAIRQYDAVLKQRVLPVFGRYKLTQITLVHVQDFVDQLIGSGLAASTVVVTILPLKVIYKRAMSRGEVTVNPTVGLRLPAVRSGRDRIADPPEAARLLEALPAADRPIWATAMYAGLRRGELMALKVSDVDLATGVIHVRNGWDPLEGEVETKSRKARRVPIAGVLRDVLDQHLVELSWSEGLLFGRSQLTPFDYDGLRRRALSAWGWRRERCGDRDTWVKAHQGALEQIGLHECRHTFASLMIAAGVNAKALSSYLGHSSIQITFDRYGHLMPGNEDEAAALLDGFLAQTQEVTARANLAPVVPLVSETPSKPVKVDLP